MQYALAEIGLTPPPTKKKVRQALSFLVL